MSAYQKNVFVGATVLVAIGMLGWMILKFGGSAASVFVEERIPIHMLTDRADGISDGSAILFRGVTVGHVSKTRRSPDNKQVIIDAMVDKTPPLPGNVVAKIRNVGLIGSGANITLTPTGPLDNAPNLKPDQQIEAQWLGLDVLPPEFADLAKELKQTTKQFREANLIEHLDQAVIKATESIASIQKLVGDEKMQKDLKESIANFSAAMEKTKSVATNLEVASADASATLKKTSTHIDDLSKQMGDRLLQVAQMLETMKSITAKVDDGKGTAGLLINDPKLYDSLVDTSRELNATIKDLKRLAEQWEQEGVSFRLK
jgi:phospholipid/cholesterol/gamma-HCH transport system substrate-binding protein